MHLILDSSLQARPAGFCALIAFVSCYIGGQLRHFLINRPIMNSGRVGSGLENTDPWPTLLCNTVSENEFFRLTTSYSLRVIG